VRESLEGMACSSAAQNMSVVSKLQSSNYFLLNTSNTEALQQGEAYFQKRRWFRLSFQKLVFGSGKSLLIRFYVKNYIYLVRNVTLVINWYASPRGQKRLEENTSTT